MRICEITGEWRYNPADGHEIQSGNEDCKMKLKMSKTGIGGGWGGRLPIDWNPQKRAKAKATR